MHFYFNSLFFDDLNVTLVIKIHPFAGTTDGRLTLTLFSLRRPYLSLSSRVKAILQLSRQTFIKTFVLTTTKNSIIELDK